MRIAIAFAVLLAAAIPGRAQTCVAAWLERIDASQLAPAEIDVSVSFAR